MMNTTIKTVLITMLGAFVGTELQAQNLHKERRTRGGLTSDHLARNVGDLLTITIQETQSVRNEDRVERSNNTSLAARLESFTLSEDTFKTNVLPRFDVRQDREFEGEARQEKATDFRAAMSVMIVDVLPNGNLVIAGSRIVEVDDETKTLKISGVVRPLDIAPNNSINSAQVADARVSITGEGANTRVNTRGPIGTFFDTLVWAAWPF